MILSTSSQFYLKYPLLSSPLSPSPYFLLTIWGAGKPVFFHSFETDLRPGLLKISQLLIKIKDWQNKKIETGLVLRAFLINKSVNNI